MKNIFLLFIIISGIAVSCDKNDDHTTPPPEQTVNFSIRPNTMLEYDLGMFGREEGAIILKQPSSAQVSRIVITENNHSVYNYLPVQDFTGNDEVLIQVNRNSDGVNSTASYLRIRIKVEL